jgi:hypothetical protein
MALRKSEALVELQDLEKENRELKEENDAARRELFWNHGHPSKVLYGEDGEMQCGLCAPYYDWKRLPLKLLIEHVQQKRQDLLRIQYELDLVEAGLVTLPEFPIKNLTNS